LLAFIFFNSFKPKKATTSFARLLSKISESLSLIEKYPSGAVTSNQLRIAPFSFKRYSSLNVSTFLMMLSSLHSPATASSFVSPLFGTSK